MEGSAVVVGEAINKYRLYPKLLLLSSSSTRPNTQNSYLYGNDSPWICYNGFGVRIYPDFWNKALNGPSRSGLSCGIINVVLWWSKIVLVFLLIYLVLQLKSPYLFPFLQSCPPRNTLTAMPWCGGESQRSPSVCPGTWAWCSEPGRALAPCCRPTLGTSPRYTFWWVEPGSPEPTQHPGPSSMLLMLGKG